MGVFNEGITWNIWYDVEVVDKIYLKERIRRRKAMIQRMIIIKNKINKERKRH